MILHYVSILVLQTTLKSECSSEINVVNRVVLYW